MKKTKGFTLIEIIIIIAVIAILAAGAALGFRGIQRNARISSLYSDASALTAALNNFNSQTLTPITGNGVVTLATISGHTDITITNTTITPTVAGRNLMREASFPVAFDNLQRRDLVISVLDIDGTRFSVNSDRVAAAVG